MATPIVFYSGGRLESVIIVNGNAYDDTNSSYFDSTYSDSALSISSRSEEHTSELSH